MSKTGEVKRERAGLFLCFSGGFLGLFLVLVFVFFVGNWYFWFLVGILGFWEVFVGVDRDHYPHCDCFRFYCGRCCWCSRVECSREVSGLDRCVEAVRGALRVVREVKRGSGDRRLSSACVCLEDALCRLLGDL